MLALARELRRGPDCRDALALDYHRAVLDRRAVDGQHPIGGIDLQTRSFATAFGVGSHGIAAGAGPPSGRLNLREAPPERRNAWPAPLWLTNL